jgi:hypothetical protein
MKMPSKRAAGSLTVRVNGLAELRALLKELKRVEKSLKSLMKSVRHWYEKM